MQEEPKGTTPLLLDQPDLDGPCLGHDQVPGVQSINHEGNEPLCEVWGQDPDCIAVVLKVICNGLVA